MAGLIALMSCNRPVHLSLLRQKTIQYPSASALEYFNGRLYIMGDDAAHMLVTDTAYQTLQTVQWFNDTAYRIAKISKPDIEAATIIKTEHGNKLVLLSSGSLRQRNYLLQMDLTNGSMRKDSFLQSRWKEQLSAVVGDINLEGLAWHKNRWLIANRGHNANPYNFLIFTDDISLQTARPVVQAVQWPGTKFVGVSGIYYWPAKDLLLLTGSEEATASATADGAIGDSHLAWVGAFSKKAGKNNLKPTGTINLSKTFAPLAGQKIESLTLEERSGGTILLHLAADNDNGQSSLFSFRFRY